MCLEVFNLGAGDIIQAVNATNAHYGGATPKGSNVFFSDFSDDPWQTASVQEVWAVGVGGVFLLFTSPDPGRVPQSVSPTMPFALVTCDDCGHCMDLGMPKLLDPTPLKSERTSFETVLAKWLSQSETRHRH